VGVDQEIVVGTVDRRVERGRMQAHLDTVDVGERPEPVQGLADLGDQSVVDALVVAAGADDVLPKPFDIDEFLRTVARYYGAPEPAPSLASP